MRTAIINEGNLISKDILIKNDDILEKEDGCFAKVILPYCAFGLRAAPQSK